MFSDGQKTFALIFIILFVAGMIYAYRKDFQKNRKYFKGTYRVIIACVVVYVVYLLLSKLL